MQIIRGKIAAAQKVVIYGPEGIGKSTFASQFPNPLFIDTEGSTSHMDVSRFPKPSSWTMLLQQIAQVKSDRSLCDTLIIDTADWAEQLCVEHVVAKGGPNIKGIEDFGYGKGYTYLAEEFGRMLNQLSDLIGLGVNVVITAHAQMRKFEQPDEMGAYDRWELKLQKKIAALVKEWADMVLFANYKTMVVNVDNQGAAKGKNKAQGGKRTMYASHHVCWDAKNRHGLADEIPFDFTSISHLIPNHDKQSNPTHSPIPAPIQQEIPEPPVETITKSAETAVSNDPLTALYDLMRIGMYTEEDVRKVVAARGYYTINTPIEKYDPGFIAGVLVGAWEQVSELIEKNLKEETPF